MASERQEGPTANGGAYAVITYMDAQGQESERDQAVGAEVIEFNDLDEQVFRTYANFQPASQEGGDNVREAA